MAERDDHGFPAFLLAFVVAVLVFVLIVLSYIWPHVADFEPLRAGLRETLQAVLVAVLAAVLLFLAVAFYRTDFGRRKIEARGESPDPPTQVEALHQPIAAILAGQAESQRGVRAFLAGIDLESVAAIDMMAITGELQVRPICEWLEEAKPLQDRAFPIRILLRADSSSDTRRIRKREATHEALDRVKQAIPGLDYEIRHYSSLSPLRGIMLQHKDGSHSAFLSFYGWGTPARMSGRELEVSWCYLRDHVAEDDKLLSVYRSWFAQFWGKHRLHTILFDFDDTLFQTTDIQVRAWMRALSTGVESGLIEKGMTAPDVRDALSDEDLLHSVLTTILLWEQQESNMIERLFPGGLNVERLEALRAIRLKARDGATVQHAVPFHALTQHLTRLHEEYQLVIVSATAEKSINSVLKKHELPFFSYVFGKEALHDWKDIEGKTPTLVRASNMLGVPLERMAFVGDSEADFRAARQLGLKFIESRLNARSFEKDSLIRSRAPGDDAFIVDIDAQSSLLAAIDQVESALGVP